MKPVAYILIVIVLWVVAVACFGGELADLQAISLIQRRAELIKQLDIDGNGKVEITKERNALTALYTEYKQVNAELAGFTNSAGVQFPAAPLPAEQLKPYILPVYGLDVNDPCCMAVYYELQFNQFKNWELK